MNRKLALVALGVALSPLLGLGFLSLLSRRIPEHGVLDGRLRECPPLPSCVCSQERGSFAVAPLRYSGTADDAWERLKRVVSGTPRMKILDDEGNYLHCSATTAVLRFVDDVEFLLDEDAQVIHVRSASRVGPSDMGANRARVEQIRKAFEEPQPTE